MSDKLLPGTRGAQILRLLSEHGPLSVRGLETILKPPIYRRRLRAALKRLGDRGLLKKKYDKIFRGSAVYYQLDWKRSGAEIARMLTQQNLPEEYFHMEVQHLELIHSESSAIWTEAFKRWLPNAIIIRDHQFHANAIAVDVLSSMNDDVDIRPDMLILLPKSGGAHRVTIGVEIERTQKSSKRIVKKLTKYAKGTLLDGVIYVCDTDGMAEGVRKIYLSKVLARVSRIQKYGQHFMLFAKPNSQSNDTLLMFNSARDPVQLSDWITKLMMVPVFERRDSLFVHGASWGSMRVTST